MITVGASLGKDREIYPDRGTTLCEVASFRLIPVVAAITKQSYRGLAAIFWMRNLRRSQGKQLVSRIAEHLAQASVHVQEMSIKTHVADPDPSQFDHVGVIRLTFTKTVPR